MTSGADLRDLRAACRGESLLIMGCCMADELIVCVDCCVPDWKINSTWTVEAATNSLAPGRIGRRGVI